MLYLTNISPKKGGSAKMLIRFIFIFVIFFNIGWYADISLPSPASIRNQKTLEKLRVYEPINFFKEQPVIFEQKLIKRNRTLKKKAKP